MAQGDRQVELAEAQEKRLRLKDASTALATFVALGFFIFVGYCIWQYMHDTRAAPDHAAAPNASSGKAP